MSALGNSLAPFTRVHSLNMLNKPSQVFFLISKSFVFILMVQGINQEALESFRRRR
jgi:hypothetical protein